MTFLIDGYNLMYFAGKLRRNLPPGRLEANRLAVLDWVADQVNARSTADQFIFVFDARNAPGPTSEVVRRGLRLRYTYDRTADDEIEELITRATRPRDLTVVSNDHRIQRTGRRAGCRVMACDEFFEWLTTRPKPVSCPAVHPPGTDKPPDSPNPAEIEEFLRVFSPPDRNKATGRPKFW